MEEEKLEYYRKELEYLEAMGYDVENPNYITLFPIKWYTAENYDLKAKILDEAVEENIAVVDTKLYQETMMERVIDGSKQESKGGINK